MGRVSKTALEYMRAGAEKALEDANSGTKPMLARAARMALVTLNHDLLAAARENSALSSAAEHSIKDTQSLEKEHMVLSEQAEWLREILGTPFNDSRLGGAERALSRVVARPRESNRPATVF